MYVHYIEKKKNLWFLLQDVKEDLIKWEAYHVHRWKDRLLQKCQPSLS